MKNCIHCGKRKRATSFYRHPQMADGRLNSCKDCVKEHEHDRRGRKQDDVRTYEQSRAMLPHRVAARKAYNETPKGKRARKKALQNYERGNPDKYKAHYLMKNAVRDGRLIRKPCEKCGDPKAEGHHENYSKPLDVTWLCQKHHKEHHRNLRKTGATK